MKLNGADEGRDIRINEKHCFIGAGDKVRFVTKEELVQLAVGKRYDEIEEIPFKNIGQGYGFKSSEAYHAGSDPVCRTKYKAHKSHSNGVCELFVFLRF